MIVECFFINSVYSFCSCIYWNVFSILFIWLFNCSLTHWKTSTWGTYFRGLKNAIFYLFHKPLVKHLKNIFLKFWSEIWILHMLCALKSVWNTAVGIEYCKQLFSLRLAFATQKKATHTAEMMPVLCVAIFWVVNASSGEKVVYSFRYRPGPGQVTREVFHIVLRAYTSVILSKNRFFLLFSTVYTFKNIL